MLVRRFWFNTFFAWLVFIGIDFLFHATLFQSLWQENIPALKSLNQLTLLIPAGYLSFYVLIVLIAYTFVKIHYKKPKSNSLYYFALTWAGLFSLSNLLGVFSYIALPLKQLVVFNFIYFIEILILVLVLNALFHTDQVRKVRRNCFFIFFGLILTSIIIQNLILNLK